MQVPLTICLVTYNRSHWLKGAIQAILDQTYTEFELDILDSGSTDDTPEVVLAFKDRRIRYLRNPVGTTQEFNGTSALAIARGDIVLVAHDDDLLCPDMVRQQMELMRANPGMAAVGENCLLIDRDGHEMGTMYPPGEDCIFAKGEYITGVLSDRIWILAAGLMFRRKFFRRADILQNYYGIKRVRSNRAIREASSEMALLAHLNSKGSIGFLGQPLLRYRQHPAQDSQHIDPFLPIIAVVRHLRRAAKRGSLGPGVLDVLDAFHLRYLTQAALGRSGDSPRPSHLIRGLQAKQAMIARLVGTAQARNALLPVGILMDQLGLLGDRGPWVTGDGESPKRVNPVCRGLMAWMRKRAAGAGLFQSRPEIRRIAILGSVFIASILILEAREHGIEVLCCLDTNPLRQGKRLLGVPIRPTAWLKENGSGLDAVLLSSEKGIRPVFAATLALAGFQGPGPVISWMDLAGAPAESA